MYIVHANGKEGEREYQPETVLAHSKEGEREDQQEPVLANSFSDQLSRQIREF